MSKSYHDLEVYKTSMDLFLHTHKLTKKLPKFELFELGSQIRRSSESIISNIVEGYGRRSYKQEFLRFLVFSHSSCLETICHFEKIIKLYPELNLESKILKEKYEKLGAMLFNFKKFVHKNWKTDTR
jgi:four helix bundle protein